MTHDEKPEVNSAERSTPRTSSKRSARRCAEEWEGVQGGDFGGVWGAGQVMGQAAFPPQQRRQSYAMPQSQSPSALSLPPAASLRATVDVLCELRPWVHV